MHCSDIVAVDRARVTNILVTETSGPVYCEPSFPHVNSTWKKWRGDMNIRQWEGDEGVVCLVIPGLHLW